MSRLHRIFRAFLLSAAFVPTLAAESETLTLYYRAAITIEPDGTLARLDWHQAGKIPVILRQKLDARVRGWQFEPGSVDGQAARTDSTLLVRLLAEPSGDGFVVRVDNAETGALTAPMLPPDYPLSALRAGHEADVLASLTVDPDGTRHVAIAGYEGQKRFRKDFVAAVEAMLAGLEVQHERVAGHPAPAEFRVPVGFCMGTSACELKAWPQLETTTGVPPATTPGAPVPVGSVARLLTDVRGTSI